MPIPTVIRGDAFAQHPIAQARRTVLLNPPIYDFRLEWANWHRPLGLEQVGAMLAERGAEVRWIDCLAGGQSRMPKHKVGTISLEGYEFVRWSFGIAESTLRASLRKMAAWKPDAVLVTSLNSLWGQGATDAIRTVREIIPGTTVALGGMYPTYATEHALQHSGADLMVVGHVPEAVSAYRKNRLHPPLQKTAGVLFYAGNTGPEPGTPAPRPAHEVVEEIANGARLGIREFVFFDEAMRPEDQSAFVDLLQALADAKLDIAIAFPGNVPPTLIDERSAQLLRLAGVKQLYLRCDFMLGSNRIRYTDDIATYARCTHLLTEVGGFRPRAGNIGAMLVAGLPFEDLAEVGERLLQLAHVVGSVLLVPFQYVPALHTQTIFRRVLAMNGHMGNDDFNSKLFPLGRLSGYPLEEYLELVRLAALVNSKYRSKTFDFLGDGLAARLLRESLRTQRWNPFVADESVSVEAPPDITLLVAEADKT